MPGYRQQDMLLAVRFLIVKSAVIVIIVNDKIQISAAEHGFQLISISLGDLNINSRIFPFKPRDQSGKNIGGEQIAGPDG